ncbi:MAG: hypothetical protein ACI9EP_001764 [Oceanospirillaceae bacterium]|jgi:hypothetical protein
MTLSDYTTLPSFEKYGKVSVWCSTTSYDTIPDSYFEEDGNGIEAWARNFAITEYNHENMETNGVASGTALVKSIIEDCSYSSAYGEGIIHKISKMGHEEVSWIILLFDFEYRNKLTKIHEDEYVQYVGSFMYDMDSISLAERDELVATREEKLRLDAQILLETEAALGATEVANVWGSAPASVAKTAPVVKQELVVKQEPASVIEPAPKAVETKVQKVAPKGHNPWLK